MNDSAMIRRFRARFGLGIAAAAVALPTLGCEPDPSEIEEGPEPTHLAEAPIWSVGTTDGPDAEIFFRVAGGKRLDDGSVVVGVRGAFEIRKFGADGAHLWTAGRRGVGPGEFVQLRLLRRCSGDRVVVYDRAAARVTEFSQEGERLSTWPVAHQGDLPYQFTCAPDGRIIYFTPGQLPTQPGIVRWHVPVSWAAKGSGAHLIRENVPGPERILSDDSYWDRPWSKELVLGGTNDGVWIGTSDDYLLELVGWDGSVIRTLKWSGEDLTATQDHVDQLREEFLQTEDGEEARNRFLRESWPDYEEVLPSRVPAYSGLMVLDDGSLWVGRWEGLTWGLPRLPGHPGKRWDVFDPSGELVRQVIVPNNMSLLDAGADWVLVVVRDDLNVQRLAVYEMEAGG